MDQGGVSEPVPPKDQRPTFRVWDGLALVAHITGFIIGPLILIGGIGFWLDRMLNGRRLIFFGSALIAFFVANFLVYKKASEISKRYK